MINRMIVFLLFAVATLPVCAAERARPEFTFGLVADVQYQDSPIGGTRDYRRALAKLEKCVADFNSKDLAFVVQLGDLVNGRFYSFDAVVARYNRLRAPRYHVLGNHDFYFEANDKSSVLRKLGMKARYYDFVQGSWRFIVLDGNDVGFLANARTLEKYYEESEAIDRAKYAEAAEMVRGLIREKRRNAQYWNGGISKTQIGWLKSRLELATRLGQRVVIFCHYPILPEGTECNLWNDDEVLQAIKPFGCVKAWINGHNHLGSYVERDGVHYLTLEGMVETSDTTAYATVEVYDDHLQLVGTGRTASRRMDLK